MARRHRANSTQWSSAPAWPAAISRATGDRVNIYPVKGYSITVNLNDAESQASAPTVSLLDDETKLVTSRLGVDRFRIAGTAEFNGVDRDIRADRIRPLIDWVHAASPASARAAWCPGRACGR
jgi:D-amino-acid dehydrogenase